MDRIEERLDKLLELEWEVTHVTHPDNALMELKKEDRDALRQQIADEWRAMVEALEKASDIHRESWHSEDERFAREIDALLARTKGGE